MNRYLLQQGYLQCSLNELNDINYSVRLMPSFCMVMAIVGLYFNQPVVHFCLFCIGSIGFLSKSYHPVDGLINRITNLFGKNTSLPVNPRPRRFACMMGALLNLLIGVFLVNEMFYWALAVTVLLVSLLVTVVSTHFCLGSWLYELLYEKWNKEEHISVLKARELRLGGALLIDVRTPQEYQKHSVNGALNIPLSILADHSIYRNKEVVIYCSSGMRSAQAVNMINSKGWGRAYDLGTFDHAQLL